MTIRAGSLDRRTLLRGAIATAAMGSFAVACGSPSSKDNGGGGPKGKKGAKNPFGVAENSKVEAAIFDGGYGTDYVDYANNVMGKQVKGVKVQVKPVVDIAPELQPRFVGGNPPDLIDNSGEDQIGFLGILDQLEELDDVFEAENYEGKKIADTVYAGVKDPGTFKDKFVALNYVMTVYGVWYSKTLFEKNGWTPPKTWDEALDLGQKAKKKGKYLFVHGKEAATYYQTLLIGGAIKEGATRSVSPSRTWRRTPGRTRPSRASSRSWRPWSRRRCSSPVAPAPSSRRRRRSGATTRRRFSTRPVAGSRTR